MATIYSTVSGALLLLFGGAFSVSGQPAERPVTVADCLTVVRADSVHLFFDSNFALTPARCAYYRREGQMDAATGNFKGEVRDYRQLNNHLLQKAHYVNGQRSGPYEEYHTNQQLAVQGQFLEGSPSGIWKCWYEDGRPHQTLEWTGQQQPRLRILAFWATDGQQQVTNGEGSWRADKGGPFPTWFGGPIVQGYQHGEWESHDARSGEVLTIEEFSKGCLKQGQQLVAQRLDLVGQQQAAQSMKYTTRPSLEIQLTDAFRQAEPLHLGYNCEQQERARAADVAVLEAMRAGKIEAILMPLPSQSPGVYQARVLRQLRNNPALEQWLPQKAGDQTKISADIDERGQLHNIVGPTKESMESMVIIFNELGNWKPAMVNGKPMPGRMELLVRRENQQLESRLRTMLATSSLPGSWFSSKDR